MPQQTKIFRVFISSTFTDMKLERSILQRDAFPKLEKFCEEHSAKFQAVDLRWGVNEESSLNQKTLQICFNEIARCQKISPKPNFLILLGDKYGWQPIPEIIPEQEMNPILEILTGDDKELVKSWYRLDENSIPPDYVLQPKERLKKYEGETDEILKLREYNNWKIKEDALRIILRNAVCKVLPPFSEDKVKKYFCSATHQEILRGPLDPGDVGKKSKEHVFAFVRNIDGLNYDSSADGIIDLVDGQHDKESKRKQDNLKIELGNKLGECQINNLYEQILRGNEVKEHYINYNASWKNSNLHIPENELQKFNNVVFEVLKKTIGEQLDGIIDKDVLTHEINLHREFRDQLTEHFKGRKEILGSIQRYLENKAEKKVMSLIGVSGSGKSSVMAKAVEFNENKGKVLLYRFIGATSGSSNIMSLLQSLCGQISREYESEVKRLAREGDAKEWHNLNGLSDIFRKYLELATAEKPLLLFLDSVDHLPETDNAGELYWLPQELPDHVRIVVSSLPEQSDKLTFAYMEQLQVLPEKEAKLIVDSWLKALKPVRRRLSDAQKDLLIAGFNKTKLPIYLKLAFEKAKKWHSYDKQHSLKEDVAGIINDYFNDLETEHDIDFVRNAVCYVLSGRYQGLAENEILEILAFDPEYWNIFLEKNEYHAKELIDLKSELEDTEKGPKALMKIPIAPWSRLYLDLEPFLTERDADGVPIITFFHRQFNKVLRERYHLPDPVIKNQPASL